MSTEFSKVQLLNNSSRCTDKRTDVWSQQKVFLPRKKPASKVAHNRPRPFYFIPAQTTSHSPVHSPQPIGHYPFFKLMKSRDQNLFTYLCQGWCQLNFFRHLSPRQAGPRNCIQFCTVLLLYCWKPWTNTPKVIIEKSRGGRFLWNRNWDLGWIWTGFFMFVKI